MRAGKTRSLPNATLFSKLYILFFTLSILLPVVHSRPQLNSFSSQSSTQILSVRSDANFSPSSTSPTDSQSPTDGSPPTSTSTTSTSTTQAQPTTTTTHHTHKTFTFSPSPSPTPTTTSTEAATTSSSTATSVATSSDISSVISSSSFSSSTSVTLVPAIAQSTLSVAPTNFQAPTTLDDSNTIPDVTSDSGAATDTSLPNDTSSNGSNSGGFLHNTGAVAGTFTIVGVVVVGGALLLVVSRLKKRKQDINYSGEDDDDYIVNDRSGRTGFASVNYGNNSMTEMSERQNGDRSYIGNDVEHTLGQEIIQQAPFDPFQNNFAFLDNTYPSNYNSTHNHSQAPLGTAVYSEYEHGEYQNDLQAHDSIAAQQTPWTGHAATEPDIPFRYEQHPYATDAVHVTPLRRQPSERAEYGLAC